MFEPAGVRTLLHMRSSAPTRPTLGRTRRLRTADPSALPSRRAGATSLLECRSACRPLTAPVGEAAALHLNGLEERSDDADEDDERDEFDDLDGDIQDPTALHDRASEAIYELQHRWLAERQSEVGRLWSQLEQEYGFSLPEDDPLRKLDDFRSGTGQVPELLARAQALEEDKEEDLEARTRAESLLASARGDLEVAHALRARLEASSQQQQAAGSSSSGGGGPPAAAAEDDERVDELRREVARLRHQAWAGDEDRAAAEPPQHSLPAEGGAPDEAMLGALQRWETDLRLLGALGRQPPVVGEVAAEGGHEAATGGPQRPAGPAGPESGGGGGEEAAATTMTSAEDAAGSGAADAAAAAMARQLDELLGELDEFDRIHDDLCKLICP